MRLLFAALLCLALPPAALAAPDESAENPYASHYTSRLEAPATAASEPRIYRGRDRDADYQRLLEQGYDQLGESTFQAADVAPELLAEQARRLHAELALVYTQRMGRVPASVKLDQAKMASRLPTDADQPAKQPPPQFYEYYASYWIKLPPPLLGVHVRRDGALAQDERGLSVIAVIQDSPAAVAGIRRGDSLLRLGDEDLRESEALLRAAQRYAGQRVVAVVERDGVELTQPVELNARQP